MTRYQKFGVAIIMIVLTPLIVYIAFVLGLGKWNVSEWIPKEKSIFANMSILCWILSVIFINKVK